MALKCLTAGAFATLLAACAGPPRLDPSSSAHDVATPANTPPRAGGTLRIGVVGDIPNLDPHQLGVPAQDIVYPIWDRLMEYDAQTRPVPALAESWDVSTDATQIKIAVRRNVRFHTGRELTSEDIRWTLMRLQTDPILAGNGFRSQVQPLRSIDVIDRYTVVLKSDAPWPGIYGLLCLMSVVDSVSMQGPNARTQAVGTGPFMFDEWVQGDHLRLVKNHQYWAAGRPYLDELVFQLFNDPQAMMAALEAGTIDLADRPPLVDAVRLQGDPRFRILISNIGGTRYALLFNALAAPTDNQQFRQALLYALDRQRIVQTVLHGIGTPLELPFASSSPAYDAARDRYYSFDLDKARSLVSESGLADTTLDFNYNGASAEWTGIAQIYQSDLARIGVELRLQPVDQVALIAERRGRTFNGVMTGIVPLGAAAPTQQAVDPYFSPVVSFSGFTSDTLTRVANDLQHETDPARLHTVYGQWSDYVLQQAWTGAIATSPPLVAMRPKLHGLNFTQLELLDYRSAWLEA
jgi:peptide/nickel transport system substrate-binding protein